MSPDGKPAAERLQALVNLLHTIEEEVDRLSPPGTGDKVFEAIGLANSLRSDLKDRDNRH